MYEGAFLEVHRKVQNAKMHQCFKSKGRKEGNVLFNDALNTFYLRLYGVSNMIAREETRCRHMGYSFRLATRVLLYALSHIQDNTVVEHWREREIAQWVRRPIAP